MICRVPPPMRRRRGDEKASLHFIHVCDMYMMMRHEIGPTSSLDRLSFARHFVRRIVVCTVCT